MDRTTYDIYWQRGWGVVEGIFGRDEVDRIAELAVTVWEQEEARTGQSQFGNVAPISDVAPDGKTPVPRKIGNPFVKHDEFANLALDQRLVGEIESLLGGKPLLMTDQIFMKPPHHGGPKPYHQDNAYFLCHPDDHVLTAWIALDDVDELNGCLRYIDESHRGPILPHEEIPGEPYNKVPPADLIDLSKESLAEVKKGGVVFHHSKALHTSHRNDSDRWRRGYATHWVTADVTSDSDVLGGAYFKRADYPGRDRAIS